jgi:hypothetical protein
VNRAQRRAAVARRELPRARWAGKCTEGIDALVRMGLGQVSAPAFLELVERAHRERRPETLVAVVKFEGGALVQLVELGRFDELPIALGPADLVDHAAREALHRAELVGGVAALYVDLRTDAPVRPFVAKPSAAASWLAPGGSA